MRPCPPLHRRSASGGKAGAGGGIGPAAGAVADPTSNRLHLTVKPRYRMLKEQGATFKARCATFKGRHVMSDADVEDRRCMG